MGNTVVLNYCAVGVGATVQAGAIAVGGNMVTEQAGYDDAVGKLAGGAEQDHLLTFGGRIPFLVSPSAQGEPR